MRGAVFPRGELATYYSQARLQDRAASQACEAWETFAGDGGLGACVYKQLN